ncbi:MAG: hypothetical protein BWZ03_00077 [bacterium ADurb.BinA186]|nr:MAG: hypothetical protein BWZ03_00077 [bacterium ADurb.BinA186]
MKYLVITTQDGDEYGLPLELVAKKRAEYYAAKDPDTTYDEEFKYVMEDSYEGIDWFRNNQNADDFKESDYKLLKPRRLKSLYERIEDREEIELRDIKE